MTRTAGRLASLVGALAMLTGAMDAHADKPVADNAASEAAPAMTAAELRRGKIAFLQCRSCHSVEPDGPHLTGPNLNGLFGAPAANKADYAYSPALSASGLIWDAETLDAWLKNPAALVSGNRMAFAGVTKDNDRELLIRYLASVTKP